MIASAQRRDGAGTAAIRERLRKRASVFFRTLVFTPLIRAIVSPIL